MHTPTLDRLLALALVALSVATASAQQAVTPGSLAPLVMGYSAILQSAILDEERELLIYLPPSYRDSDRRYPVLWVLDGLANFHHASGSAAVLAMNGVIPELIVVGVVNVDRDRDFTATVRGDRPSGGADDFVGFLADEAVPYMDHHFRTLPHRTLVGHSLGALLALHTEIRRPELFQGFLLVSPALSADERELPPGVAQVSDLLARRLAATESPHDFYFVTMSGQEEQRWHEDLEPVLRTLRRQGRRGLKWQYRSYDDETHGTNPVRSVYEGLRAQYADWLDTRLLMGADTERIETHYRELSERFGYPVELPEGAVNRIAYACLESGRTRDALRLFELNLRHHPQSANTHDSLGEALERSGRFAEALVRYNEAVALAEAANSPALPVYRSNRDRVAALVGPQ